LAGHTPDRAIDLNTFVDVANEVYQFLSGNANARLTPKQINDLIDAIVKQCGPKKTGLLIIFRPPATAGGGGGGGGSSISFGSGGGWGWDWDEFDLLELLSGMTRTVTPPPGNR
jgi:hypothetical protein